MMKRFWLGLFATLVAPLGAQLDPTRNLPVPAASAAAPLPEQYIWTANDLTLRRPDRSKFSWSRPDLRATPHYFRGHFRVDAVPAQATVYIAGPREAHVYLNGHLLGDFFSNTDAPINFRVFHADAARYIQRGDNVLAVQAIRGRGVVTGAGPILTSELAYGEVLAAKIVPAAFGFEGAPLLISDGAWRSSAIAAADWQLSAFNDGAWTAVESLGSIENIDFYQWSADAGMYGWPGYRGMSAALRNYTLPAAAVSHVFRADAFANLESLTSAAPEKALTVSVAAGLTDAESPSLLLDFGREVAGRLLVESASAHDATLSIAYGESELEAEATGITPDNRGGNYLGTNLLEVPANGVARGPKSAFRYVLIRFLRGSAAFKSIRMEGIYYPVTYAGSFESSDPLLNRIWETGAYTAHLCMQDGIWDAPKRDRGSWVGDLDVEARTILDAFGDKALIEETLLRLANATPANAHVNGIAGYTALWLTSMQTLYEHTGDRVFLETQRAHILQLLARMDQDIGADNLLTSSAKGWGFVDWAPGMYGQTEATRIGTNLQYLRGFQAGVSLLTALGDAADAAKYSARSEVLSKAAAGYSFGETWHLNTLATLTHLEHGTAWAVLSRVKQDSPTDQVISPYFGAYLLDAMTSLGHADAALKWIRSYWGGMLAEGATSFWESYDLRWPKTNFHLSLEADGTSGYFVSLAHGWSSGPTAWLSENVLGVRPSSAGYDTVTIAPELLGLEFARGSVPTPHGVISVDIEKGKGITVDLPAGVREAVVKLPGGGTVVLNTPGRHFVESH
jgi:hypothetical protein